MALGRDADGFYAMTLICTHQGCDMSRSGLVNSAGAVCGCHGARFDRNGNVVSGPARSALVHFAVAVDSATGVVTIDTDTVVSSSERAPA
jgi:Rieske Fe-S protein